MSFFLMLGRAISDGPKTMRLKRASCRACSVAESRRVLAPASLAKRVRSCGMTRMSRTGASALEVDPPPPPGDRDFPEQAASTQAQHTKQHTRSKFFTVFSPEKNKKAARGKPVFPPRRAVCLF